MGSFICCIFVLNRTKQTITIMADTTHNYAKEITFEKHSKEMFDKLLDQVKVIDINEYNEEAKDGFQDLYTYWNERSRRVFNHKLKSNARNIEHKK